MRVATPELANAQEEEDGLMVQTSTTCEDIGQAVWDGMFGAEDVDSYKGLRMQESVFGAKTIDGPMTGCSGMST